MSDDKINLNVGVTGGQSLTKIPKDLQDATKAAAALSKQLESVSTQITSLASAANNYTKRLNNLVKGAQGVQASKFFPSRQTTGSSDSRTLDAQIEAQKARYAAEYLKNQNLTGAAQASNLKTVQKELDALTKLQALKQDNLTLDKQASQITAKALTIQEQLNKNVSQYRIARQAGQSGEVSVVQNQLNRAGLLIDRQRLIVEQARVTSNGQYTTELANQETRLARLMNIQSQLKNQQANQPRVIKQVDLASLFKIQAELMVNYTLMNQLFNLFHFGTSYVVEYDKALHDLQAVTKTTDTEAQGLSQTFIDVSESTKFSAVEIAKAAVTMGQAGFSAQQIKDSIKSVTLLATATGSDLSSSVDIATSAITVFNLNAGEMSHVADVMTGALNLSKLTMDKLALGIQYAGNTAAEAGIGLEEFVSVLGGIANAGIKSGSTIGTGFQQLLVELQKPTTKLTNQLKQVGLTMSDVDVKAHGFTNVMETLANAGFNSANALAAFDLRGAKAYLSISRNIDAIKEMRAQVLLSNAAAEANAKQMESLANSASRLRNILGASILAMSGPTEKALVTITNLLGDMFAELNKLGVILPIIGTLLTTFVTAAILVKLTSLISAFSGLGVVIGEVGAALALMVEGGLAAVGPALLALMTNPVIAVTVALTAMIAAVYGGSAAFSYFSANGGKTLDALQADADKAKGAFEKTQQQIESIGAEVDNLTTKYAQYKGSSEDVKNEVLAMQLRFGELSNKIRTDAVTSVDELIDVLRELQGELNKTSIKELQNSIASSSYVARARMNKLATQSAAQNDQTFTYGRGGNVTGTRASSIANPAADAILQGLRQSSLGDMSLDQIKQYQAQLEKVDGMYKTQIAKYSKDAEALVAQRKDDSEEQDKINKVRDMMLQVEGQLNDSNVVYNQKKQELIAKIEDSDPFKAAVVQLDDYNKQLAEAKKAQGEAKTPEQKAKAEALAKAIQAKIQEFWDEYMKGVDNVHVKEIVDQLNAENPTGPKTDPKLVQAALEQTIGNKAADAESRAKGTGAPTTAMNFYDKYSELAKLKITEIERQIKHSTDLVNQKISAIDAVINEASDLEHGGLAGKYSDAEIFAMQEKKKNLQTEALAEQIRQYDELNPKVSQLVDYEQKLLDKAQKAYNQSKGGKDEGEKLKELVETTRDYNDAKDKEIDAQNKATEAKAKYNAATGEETMQHMSLNDQISQTVEQYSKQMASQNSLSNNVRKNVIEVMDSANSSFSTFVQDVGTGTKSVGQAFRDMATSIIKSMLDIAARSAGSSLFGSIFGSLGGIFGSQGSAARLIQTGSTDFVGPLPVGANGGGLIKKRYAAGGSVPGRDSVPALLRPGEFVLRNSAVDMIGQKNLERINTAGNTRTSGSGSQLAKAANDNPSQQLGTPVNVYVVAPDQKPPLTKNDIVATISDDIYKGGQTIKLIKTVIGGRT